MTTYLDHAATTPPRPEAREALSQWLDAANASSSHAQGQRARVAVEHAREQVATALECSPHDVVFTSGGTEADNLAIKGIVWAARERTRSLPHLVVSAVEHAAVREPARWLAQRGDVRLTEVPPDADGHVDPGRVLDAVRDDTVLVSVMTANNEIGTVNDVAELAVALADSPTAVHTDAVQAFATREVDLASLPVDALSLSAHKFGGPQGVGVVVLRRGLPVEAIVHGGGQDRGVRSGTYAAALDAACGAAVAAAAADRDGLDRRLGRMSARLAEGLLALDGVRLTGPAEPPRRLSSHVHVMIDAVDPEALVLELDRARVAASSGSACGSGAAKASHVLEAIGAVGTPLRLTLGWTSTDDDVDRALEVLGDVIVRMRASRTAALGFEPLPGVR